MENQIVAINGLNEMCKQAVQRLRNLPGFQLYEENEFIQLVYRRCQQENLLGPENVFQNIALNIYAEGLYQAVISKNKLSRQEVGFQELSKYLYRMAFNFYLHQTADLGEPAEKAQESTQVALERIYLHLENVKSPGGFLKWSGTILRNICLEEVRGRKKMLSLDDEESKIELSGNDENFQLDSEHDRECLTAAILRLKDDYRLVIRFTFFSQNENGGKVSDEDIANTLNIDIGNLYTIRSRALSVLRKDKRLIDCMQNSL